MARKKSKRSHASYVRAGRKAARTRARKRRRKNPTRHRPVVYSYGRGKKKRLRRSPLYRLKPRRVNPKRRYRKRRYRRNPIRLRAMGQRYFGKARMQNAIMLLIGIGGAAAIKGVIAGIAPVGVMRDWLQRLYGGISIVLGVTLQMQSRRKAVKSAGMGMVVFGLYDLIVSNTPLGAYLPTISAPSAFARSSVSGYQDFGRMTYNSMGASLSPGATEVVGGNITGGEMPEVIGEDMDLADALEMAS